MAGSFDPAVSMFSGGIAGLLKYWWVGAIVLVLGIIAGIVWYIGVWKKKNGQWTHKLTVKFETPAGDINDNETTVIKMRRWKHKDENTPPLFELEKPLLGSRIFVELEKYSARTAYEIVLGNDGRIYIPTKTIMCRDKNALQVSVKHAGIDRSRQGYANRFEQQNATPKKIDGLTLLKYGFMITVTICLMIVMITGLKEWSNQAQYKSAAAQAETASWEAMDETMDAVNSALNAVTLILPDLKGLYGNNIQGAIKGQKEKLNQS